MPRMAKRYQGLRARQMLNILKGREETTQPQTTTSLNPGK